jgi:hypothetical protein
MPRDPKRQADEMALLEACFRGDCERVDGLIEKMQLKDIASIKGYRGTLEYANASMLNGQL